jgi:tRNA threonylcarbamoyladenosine biosynthesis protein TsaE
MSGLTLTTDSPEATQAFGRHIGEALGIGDVVLLAGTLGAGKTTLTQGIAWGAGVTEYAHSPTFVLVHEYAGRIPIYHLDLYRFEGASAVDDLAEVEDLGIDEMLETGACVVEWAE